MPETPTTRITDPQRLRALSHPLRWRLIEAIEVQGPVTATRCAEITGESVASCSYHLNLLAKYGFVEPADRDGGREKPWRLTSHSRSWSTRTDDVEAGRAAAALTEVYLDHEFAMLRDSQRVPTPQAGPWRDAAAETSSGTTFLTAAEMIEVTRELREIVLRYRDRLEHPHRRPDGARAVRIFTATYFPDLAADPTAPTGSP